MEKEILETKHKSKKTKKIILVILATVLAVCVVAGGFFAFKYIFPSDKDLFLIAHTNIFSGGKTSVDVYTKDTSLSFELKGDFTSQKAVDTVKSISVLTRNTHFGEGKSTFDFNMQFLNKEFLSFVNADDGEKEILSVPRLIETSYAASDAEEVLSMLLGSDSAKDIDILEGIDKATFDQYLKNYGTKLYNNLPDNAFSAAKDSDIKTITFTDDVNRMLYDIVTEIRSDNEFCSFLYGQTSIIYTNINGKFPYAGTLLTIPSESEFEENYNKSLDDFVKNIENAKITAKARIQGRKLLSENIKVTNGNETLYDVSYDNGNIDFIQYKESKEHIHYTTSAIVEETKTHRNTVFSIDVNEWTKQQIEGQKIVSVIIDSVLDTSVTEEYSAPTEYIDITTLTEAEKVEIQETVSENVTELIASFTLALLFL